MVATAAPSSASPPMVLAKGGSGGGPSKAWERDPCERSRASSLLDKPTGTGTDSIRRNGSGKSSMEDGRWNNRWWKSIWVPAASGAASVSVNIVGLNGVIVTCVP